MVADLPQRLGVPFAGASHQFVRLLFHAAVTAPFRAADDRRFALLSRNPTGVAAPELSS